MAEEKTSKFELCVAALLGFAAVGGGWSGFQSNQWGSTATEDYGKAATAATRAATVFNLGVAVANRDSAIDLRAKELVVTAMTTEDKVAKDRDMNIARYLYTQQLSSQAYGALGLPPEFHTKDKAKAVQLSDEAMEAGVGRDLDDAYVASVLAAGAAKFEEADAIFAEGQKVSGLSTDFGLDGVFFTVALFLGGMSLVIKSRARWGFLGAGYAAFGYALFALVTLPWY